jgi:hypothetical protein
MECIDSYFMILTDFQNKDQLFNDSIVHYHKQMHYLEDIASINGDVNIVDSQLMDEVVLMTNNKLELKSIAVTSTPTSAPTTLMPTSARPTSVPTTSEPAGSQSVRRAQNVKRTLTPTTSKPTKKPTSRPNITSKPTTLHPTTAKPTVQPTPSPSGGVQPPGSASIAPSQFKCMSFSAEPAADLVSNTFINPDGGVEFQNVLASSHACFLHFSNGNQMGKHELTNEYLVPQEGIILSSGKPEDFCWNDSDEMTTEWKMPGDADLTSFAHQVNPLVETFDAVSVLESFLL